MVCRTTHQGMTVMDTNIYVQVLKKLILKKKKLGRNLVNHLGRKQGICLGRNSGRKLKLKRWLLTV